MYTHTLAATRRMIALVAALTLMVVGLLAAPASADAPITFTTSGSIVAPNPCTGEVDVVTWDFEWQLHEHASNIVVQITRIGSTSSGYVADHGVETIVANGNVERAAFSEIFRHEDGSKFRASGHFTYNINQGELVVDQFDLTCLGN